MFILHTFHADPHSSKPFIWESANTYRTQSRLTGTAVGNRLYAQGGWVWSGSYNSKPSAALQLVCSPSNVS
jgi:hypothetical protein